MPVATCKHIHNQPSKQNKKKKVTIYRRFSSDSFSSLVSFHLSLDILLQLKVNNEIMSSKPSFLMCYTKMDGETPYAWLHCNFFSVENAKIWRKKNPIPQSQWTYTEKWKTASASTEKRFSNEINTFRYFSFFFFVGNQLITEEKKRNDDVFEHWAHFNEYAQEKNIISSYW